MLDSAGGSKQQSLFVLACILKLNEDCLNMVYLRYKTEAILTGSILIPSMTSYRGT